MKKIKNFIKTNRLFWKYRHIYDATVWQSYTDDGLNPRREYYANFINEKLIDTVFEFGCASGPNLIMIRDKCGPSIKYQGFDINNAAIEKGNKELGNSDSIFSDKISATVIEDALTAWDAEYFGLSIYDRVLYLMSENEVFNHFKIYGKYFRYIIIDDFSHKDSVRDNGAYFTKNYTEILGVCGFEIIEETASDHIKNEKFFIENAKKLVFKSKAFGASL